MNTPGLDRSVKSEDNLKRFEHYTEIPMLLLSVVFLVALVLPVLDTDLSHGARHVVDELDIIVWIVFVVEYVVRLILAPRKIHFILRNILDLVVVVVPVLRPLRVARLARFARIGAVTGLASRHSRGHFHIDTTIQVILIAVIIVFVGAVGMLDVERNAPGSNIHSFGDALWWAISTITAVGYGDKFPVTGQGHLIGAVVMITGVAVLGTVTASVASWFIDSLQQIEGQEARASGHAERFEEALNEVLERLARIEVHIGTGGSGEASEIRDN